MVAVILFAQVRDLARGVGLQGYFFPYTDPSEIFQKA